MKSVKDFDMAIGLPTFLRESRVEIRNDNAKIGGFFTEMGVNWMVIGGVNTWTTFQLEG